MPLVADNLDIRDLNRCTQYCGITDTFDRPDQSDWGTSSGGLPWTPDSGGSSWVAGKSGYIGLPYSGWISYKEIAYPIALPMVFRYDVEILPPPGPGSPYGVDATEAGFHFTGAGGSGNANVLAGNIYPDQTVIEISCVTGGNYLNVSQPITASVGEMVHVEAAFDGTTLTASAKGVTVSGVFTTPATAIDGFYIGGGGPNTGSSATVTAHVDNIDVPGLNRCADPNHPCYQDCTGTPGVTDTFNRANTAIGGGGLGLSDVGIMWSGTPGANAWIIDNEAELGNGNSGSLSTLMFPSPLPLPFSATIQRTAAVSGVDQGQIGVREGSWGYDFKWEESGGSITLLEIDAYIGDNSGSGFDNTGWAISGYPFTVSVEVSGPTPGNPYGLATVVVDGHTYSWPNQGINNVTSFSLGSPGGG
jgi:hypothetical protein